MILSNEFKYFSGYGFGLREPFLMGTMSVTSQFPLKELEQTLCSIFPNMEESQISSQNKHYLPLRLLESSLIIQRLFKIPVFSPPRIVNAQSIEDKTKITFVLPCFSPNISMKVLTWLQQMLADLRHGEKNIPHHNVENLKNELTLSGLMGINSFRMYWAAHQCGIPVNSLVSGIFIFGHGQYSRWLESTLTDETSVLGVKIAASKVKTASLLRTLGFPAPYHELVSSLKHAQDVAAKIGYPIVIKPSDAEGGHGVSAGLKNQKSIARAYQKALEVSENILVEKHMEGNDYRLTIFNGTLIKTILRRPGGVVGDGRKSISELLEIAKQDPQVIRRSKERGYDLLRLDDEANELLNEAGYTLESIVPEGYFQPIRRKANAYAGGITTMIPLDEIHPDNRRLAERAAEALRLDIAGVDLIIPDISKSWREVGAVICEMNAQPQIGDSHTPEIYKNILTQLVPGSGRIPIALTVGDNNALLQKIALKIDAVLVSHHIEYGKVFDAKGQIGEETISAKEADFFSASRVLLFSQKSKRILLYSGFKDILSKGLPCDGVNVTTLIPPMENNPQKNLIFFQTASMILPHTKTLIISADDERSLELKQQFKNLDPSVWLMVSKNADHSMLQMCITQGGQAIWREKGHLVIASNNDQYKLVYSDKIRDEESFLYTVAQLYAMGISIRTIEEILKSYNTN